MTPSRTRHRVPVVMVVVGMAMANAVCMDPVITGVLASVK